jgi:hypothetical protein
VVADVDHFHHAAFEAADLVGLIERFPAEQYRPSRAAHERLLKKRVFRPEIVANGSA